MWSEPRGVERRTCSLCTRLHSASWEHLSTVAPAAAWGSRSVSWRPSCMAAAPISHLILLPPPVVLALVWGVLAAATCFIMPIWESRKHIMDILSHVMTCTPSSTQGEAFVGAPKGVDAAAVVDGAAAKAAPPMSS